MRQGGQPAGQLSDPSPVSGAHSVAIGVGLTAAVAGSTASFIVHGCDRAGRPILPMGLLASVLVVDVRGPGTTSHRFESLGDGSVRVWYTAPISGSYKMKIGIRNASEPRIEPFPGSPYHVRLPEVQL